MREKIIVNMKVNSKKCRLIYDSEGEDPCRWQLQIPHRLFFWKDLHGRCSSVNTAIRYAREYLESES